MLTSGCVRMLRRHHVSCSDLKGNCETLGKHTGVWTLTDVVTNCSNCVESSQQRSEVVKLPLASFNHIAREVLSLETSRKFYVDILGFQQVPRPPFDSEGYWLWGYGLSLHLVETTVPDERKTVKRARIKHFSTSLPRVDHFAFLTTDISYIKTILDNHKVYYKHDVPKNTGIEQIFLFDPDGNVIEISNCAPPVGEIKCSNSALTTSHGTEEEKEVTESTAQLNDS